MLIGDQGNDTLNAGDGDDDFIVLAANFGNDVFQGGAGWDILSFGDLYQLGITTFRTSRLVLDAAAGVEVLEMGYFGLTGTRGDDLFDLTGVTQIFVDAAFAPGIRLQLLGGNDVYRGADGYNADRVDGGTGQDSLWGGGGNDTLIGDDGSDGLFGEDGVNTLIGGSGNDKLVTKNVGESLDGGRDNDTLIGGRESTLLGGDGNDRLISNGGNNILNGGHGNDELVSGNSGDSLYGGNGSDTLTAGIGAETLYGGAGNDVQYAAGGYHQVLFGEGGNDRLVASYYTNSLYGGDGDDTLYSGDNRLLLDGGAGDDAYEIGSFDYFAPVEAVDSGRDAVYVKYLDSYRLPQNIEDLFKVSGTVYGLFGSGNSLDNRITGGNATDTLDGGRGNDMLTGGGSSDHFVFTSTLGARNADTITDFQHDIDKIDLDSSGTGVFVASSIGALGASAFKVLGADVDADDRILYDQVSGKIFYDVDGNGVVARELFALVSAGVTLTSTDFLVI